MARAALVALALIGCHHQRPTLYGEPVPDGCSAEGPIGNEDCMGWYVDRTKMLSHQSYEDAELARYVTSVGERVVRATGDRRHWRFRVLDESDPQAEANISTTVYITRGALARLRDEAELAGILGHEIGHVVAGHAREAIVEFARGRSSTRDLRAQRDDEIQADELAVLFAARSGYDPRAVETMLRALAAGESEDTDHSDDVHPAWTERIARLQAFAGNMPPGGEHRAREYLAHIAHLVIGFDPRAVAVVGGAAVFARARIAVDFPRGWTGSVAMVGVVSVAFADDANVIIYLLPRGAASQVKPLATHDAVTDTIPIGDKLLVIKTTGSHDVARMAAQVRAAIRTPTAIETSGLAPRYIDLGAKRPLWPEPVDAPKDADVLGFMYSVPTTASQK